MTAVAPPDRYRRLDLLGRGGMGEVFLAEDLLLKRKVAIKIVHRSDRSNPRAEKLLRREAKAAAALDNPFICKVYEVGEAEGRVFIAMEYVQGETLRQRMTRGPMLIREVVSLAYMRDLSHSELAEQLKLPLGTVQTWIRRGLEQLRGCMARFA